MIIICMTIPLKVWLLVGYAKIASNYSFPFKRYKTITVCRCTDKPLPKKTCLYCIYLFKLYDIMTILMLKNNLTNICSEISKIRFILWLASTCNVKGKGSRKLERWVESECTLPR